MGVVSVSLPDGLLEQVDDLIEAKAYAGRSEAVRASLRDLLAKEAATTRRPGARTATMTLVYPKGNERKIGDIRHAFGDIVKSMLHSDTVEHCTEVFILQGEGDRITEFSDRLRGHRETKLVQAVFTD